jgi:hypothetical protein
MLLKKKTSYFFLLSFKAHDNKAISFENAYTLEFIKYNYCHHFINQYFTSNFLRKAST